MRQNAQHIADENDIEIEFIRKLRAFHKDDRIQQIISETSKTEGLIHIFSAMEQCTAYKPWHDKTTGKTFLKFDQSKCLHYYFYFIDKELGLCYYRKKALSTVCMIILFLVNELLIIVRKKLALTIISEFSARGSNTIWVMYQLKCMINSARSYG